MISVRALGFIFLMTLVIGKTIAQGNLLLQPGNGKEPEIKTADKRVDKFRVPVDTSFDPNFWPSRGRRGEVGGEIYDYATSPEANSNWDKNNFQCHKRFHLSDIDTPINQKNEKGSGKVDDTRNRGSLEEVAEDCYDIPRSQVRSLKVCKTRLKKNPSMADTGDYIWLLTSKAEGKRHKQQQQQRYQEIPAWFNSEYLIMKPDTWNGEKEKKQDVFWVARGKRSSK